VLMSAILATMQASVLVIKTQSAECQTWYFIYFYIPLLSDQVSFSDVRCTRVGRKDAKLKISNITAARTVADINWACLIWVLKKC